MLTFRAVFPLTDNIDLDAIDRVAKKWLIGSPHSQFDETTINEGESREKWTTEVSGETATFIRCEDDELDHFGLRYEKLESDGIRWLTELVALKSPRNVQVAIQVHSDAETTAVRLPPARKPYIVRQLLTEIGGGSDGSLSVSDKPLELAQSEIEFAADIVLGQCGNELPVVYVSAPAQGRTSVEVGPLARWLSGIAHVVVESNREFSFRLMNEVSHQNTYGGAVGIYWPDRSKKHVLFPKNFEFDSKVLAAEISRVIRDRAIRLRVPRSLTWAHITERTARQQLATLQAEGSKNLDEYIENFDTELKAKEEALEKAEAEIRRLEAEVHALGAKTKDTEGRPVLVRGAEQDLYEDETVELLREILYTARNNSEENSRRRHVFDSLLATNSGSGAREELMVRIKSILSTYKKLEGSIEHDLEELGFDISREGKHYKLVFRGDSRYQIILPKTSSDHRAGKNLVSQINKLLF